MESKFLDIHVHVVRQHCVPVRLGSGGDLVNEYCEPEELIALYDDLDIEKGLLLPEVSPECIPQTVSNEEILAICADYPDRFVPGCNIDPRNYFNDTTSPFASGLRWYKDKGCRILGEICCSMQMLDPRLQALFKAAQDVDIPILFHLAPFVDDNYGLADLPGLPGLEETLRKFPKLKVFGHSQAFWCEMSPYKGQNVRFGYPKGRIEEEGRIQELMRRYPNLYGDLSAGSGYNALVRDREYAAKFLAEFQDRLFFATDICSPELTRAKMPQLGTLLRDMVARGEISQEVFDKVAAGNARRVLGM